MVYYQSQSPNAGFIYLYLKNMHKTILLPVAACLAACACLLPHAAHAIVPQAAPLLQCRVTYADTTHEVTARISADPYSIDAVDIGGRFRFKAVMIGHGSQIDYIKLYAYLDTARQPILIQQATYLPPFRVSDAATPLTGQQRLYASEVERELQYVCSLQAVAS